MTDRVHDVSEYVASPCGQALLACPTGSRASPGFDELRWAGAGVLVAVSVCTLTPYTHIHTPGFTRSRPACCSGWPGPLAHVCKQL